MEILDANYLGLPTTEIYNTSGTMTASDYNFLDRDTRYPSISVGYNNDAASFIIVASFTSELVFNRCAIMGNNLKEFSLTKLVTGIGFTTISLLPESGTIVSSWISNSATSMYLMFNDITTSQFRLVMTKTMSANDEKSVGYLALSKNNLTLSQKPGYAGYSLLTRDKSISHAMANGGYRYQTLSQKFSAKLQMDYVPASLHSSLYDLYYNRQEMIFVPNPPTTTASTWDTQLFPCVWANGFDFETYSDNCSTPYFSGTIELDEVPK